MLFFFNDTATTEIYTYCHTLSLHDALPIYELGVLLFDRDRRGTRLTAAGTVCLQDTRRLFTVLEQARENAKAVAAGSRGSLRIAVSDGDRKSTRLNSSH